MTPIPKTTRRKGIHKPKLASAKIPKPKMPKMPKMAYPKKIGY